MSFTPKREDGRPVWRVIHDHVVKLIDDNKLGVGDLLPHATLRALLNEEEQRDYYVSIGRTSKELMDERSRVLVSERGLGYRLAAGMGQVQAGDNKKKKASKEMKKALQVYQTSDRGLMSATEMMIADKKQSAALFVVGVLAMHEEKINKVAEDINHLRSAQRKSEAEVSDTAEKVAELERRFNEWSKGKST